MIENLGVILTKSNMAKGNAMPSDDSLTKNLLGIPQRPKIRIKSGPSQPGQIIIHETRVDIDALLKDAMEAMAFQGPPIVDVARQLSRVSLTAEDSFTPGGKLLQKKYEEGQIILPNYLSVTSGETTPQELEFDFDSRTVYGFSTSGLPRANGQCPENTNGIVLKETAGKYLTAVMLAGDDENPETSALINAASVYAANEMHLNNEERFPMSFESLSGKTAPISQEMGLEDVELKGLTARLDQETYTLEVSGNTDQIHCLVIDPKTGVMESFNSIKEQEYKESQLLNVNWDRIRTMVESEFSGEKKEKMVAGIARIEEEGLSENEKRKMLASIPLPRQISIKMPVSSGDIVVLANDKLLEALKAKSQFPGLVQAITEGLAKGKSLKEICKELMTTVAGKEQAYEVEEASRSLIAYQVP